jgi:hypothetical protein
MTVLPSSDAFADVPVLARTALRADHGDAVFTESEPEQVPGTDLYVAISVAQVAPSGRIDVNGERFDPPNVWIDADDGEGRRHERLVLTVADAWELAEAIVRGISQIDDWTSEAGAL